jgi:cysteine desulfurase
MNLSFEGLKGEVIVHMLEEQGIYLSTSSACSSHNKTKKSILSELGYTKKRIDGTIRISLSLFNTYEEVDYLIKTLKTVIDRLNSLHLKG